MFRRKQKKDVQLVGITERNGEAAVLEKYAPKTSSEVKARRRAVRSMSFQHSFKKREPVEPKKQASRKTSQPDPPKETPIKKEMVSSSPQPVTMADAKLKLVTVPDEETRSTAIHTSNFKLRIFPSQGGRDSQNGQTKYRHSTYISGGSSSFTPSAVKNQSKKKERKIVEEEEAVEVFHFDDTTPTGPRTSGQRPLSMYDRERTNTETSTFDLSYEL